MLSGETSAAGGEGGGPPSIVMGWGVAGAGLPRAEAVDRLLKAVSVISHGNGESNPD